MLEHDQSTDEMFKMKKEFSVVRSSKTVVGIPVSIYRNSDEEGSIGAIGIRRKRDVYEDTL